MKKILVCGTENDKSLASVVGYLEGVELNVLAPIDSTMYERAKQLNLSVTTEIDKILINEYDLVLLYDYSITGDCEVEILKFHPSLLPAFNTKEPVKDAFYSGVKVSGVTVYSVTRDKIIAQFPVLLDNDTHFDEFEANIIKTENILYPRVIKAVLENRVFNFSDLMGGNSSGGCSGHCGGCSGCK